MRTSHLLALALSVATSNAVYQGFNYGSTQSDGSYKEQSDFQDDFKTAKSLVGTSGFTSARLYTMLQGGSSDPTSAIPAAIAEDTSLLLGLWASGGDAGFQNELAALAAAIKQYGSSFTKLVVGISVGSEDLYRNSVIGVENKAGVGANPSTLAGYIGQVRKAISGTGLSQIPVGHVDTWTAWVNSSNDAVIQNSDFIGVDAYPYFQNTMSNPIGSARSLFESAIQQTQAAVGSKKIWITETGWPVSGNTSNLAVPSIANAKTYWDEVGCALFGKVNTWWFTLQDSDPVTPNPSFGLIGSTVTTQPLYNLTCPQGSTSSSIPFTATVSANPSSTGGSSVSSSPPATSNSGSGSGSGSGSSSSSSSSSGSGSGSGSGSSGSGSSSSSGSSSTQTTSPNAASIGSSGSLFGVVVAFIAAIAIL